MITEDVKLFKGVFTNVAEVYFNTLLEGVNWQKILTNTNTGEPAEINRKMAYVSDFGEDYRYANLMLIGSKWRWPLTELRDYLIDIVGKPFNSVLLNLYETGKDEIKWHADKERQLGDRPVIACVNLGATRTFHFKNIINKEERHEFRVENGDLLVMYENCQKKWLHAILKEPAEGPRISLTYRYVQNEDY